MVMNNVVSIVFSTSTDRPGLVHDITKFFAQLSINIDELEEHVDDGCFFMRVTIKQNNSFTDKQWQTKLTSYFKPLGIDTRFHSTKKATTIVLFCSKELHCLVDILNQINNNEINASVVAVFSNHRDAASICHAFNIPFIYEDANTQSKKQYEQKIVQALDPYQFDCVGLAKYMQILSPSLLSSLAVPIINIHHSFLPAFKGANPYKQAYLKGVKLIGATAHYVTESLDDGPIIAQEVAPITHLYSIHDLKLKGYAIEKKVFSDAINKHINNKVVCNGNRTIVFH